MAVSRVTFHACLTLMTWAAGTLQVGQVISPAFGHRHDVIHLAGANDAHAGVPQLTAVTVTLQHTCPARLMPVVPVRGEPAPWQASRVVSLAVPLTMWQRLRCSRWWPQILLAPSWHGTTSPTRPPASARHRPRSRAPRHRPIRSSHRCATVVVVAAHFTWGHPGWRETLVMENPSSSIWIPLVAALGWTCTFVVKRIEHGRDRGTLSAARPTDLIPLTTTRATPVCANIWG